MPEPPYKHLAVAMRDGVPVVTITLPQVQGDTLAEELRQELFAVIDRTGTQQLVLDFLPVTYVSSAAFRPLLSLRRKLQSEGGRFVVCNLCPNVAEVFIVTRLVSTSRSTVAPFEMEAGVEAALARLREPPLEKS